MNMGLLWVGGWDEEKRPGIGESLMYPSLEYGHVAMEYEELAAIGEAAIAAGVPIDWSKVYAPLGPGELS